MTLATRTVTLPGGLQATGPSAAGDRAAAGAGRRRPPRTVALPGWRTCWNICCLRRRALPDDDRLMGWRRGGSVNATTARHSAFFSRLPPMLWLMASRVYRRCCRPAAAQEDIQREVAVIDAEYRLIQQHEPSRREAAVRHAASAPRRFAAR